MQQTMHVVIKFKVNFLNIVSLVLFQFHGSWFICQEDEDNSIICAN